MSFLLLAVLAAADAAPLPPSAFTQDHVLVLRHARVLTAVGPSIADGAVVLDHGRIVAVGPSASVATPPGAEELDETGKVITPGIVDAHSHMGVYSVPESFSTADGNEATGPITAEVRAEHSLWPQDPALARAAAGGVTTALVLPGSANLIGGRGVVIKLHPSRTPSELKFPGAPDSMKFACGENPRRTYGKEKKGAPLTRMGNIALVRQAFSNARDYLNRWGEYHEKVRKDPAKAGLAPARDLRLEAIGSVLTGETLAQVHCYRADDMDDMLQVSDEFGFKIRAFHHAVEAYKIRDVLAKRGIGVATWHHWWGFKLEAWDAIPENASLLSRAGVPVAIHSDSSLGTQHLPQNAGYALGAGRAVGVDVSDDEAIRWVTLNPAWILGVDRLTGSLEVGKAADVVVWDRSPMSSVARAERVYADGVLTFDLAHGPQFISDFEVEQPPLLTARPAPLLEGLAVPATCDPRRGPCPGLVTLDVTATCTAIQHVTALVDGVARADVTVVLKGGKVAALDAKAEPPAGCRRVDGVGRVLAPGFIDPYSVLGLAEVDQEESTSELSPRGDAARPTIRAAGAAADNVNATSAHLPTARRAGITGALIGPRHNGLVWGQGAFLALDGTVPRRAVAMYASLSQTARDSTGLPRGQLEATLRDALADARLYAAKKADYDANRLRPLAASRADLEALQKVLKGELPLVIEAHRALDIRAAIDLGQVEKLKVIIAGAEEGHLVAAELARAKVPVIIRPLNDLPYNYESLASRPDNAALLTKAGVTVLLSTMGMPGEEVQLPQEAALAVSWGLPEADALGGLTGKVADVFGLDTGHLAVGKRADVVLWSGDPIESSSTPLGIWIGGTQVTLESHASALREKYWVPGRR